MTEKEKMMKGMWYMPFDKALHQERIAAKTLCRKYNLLDEKDCEKKHDLLNQLLGSCHERAHIEPNFYCDYGYNIHLGKNFYANHNCVILDCGLLNVGDNVLFGPNITISTAGHPVDAEARKTGAEFAKPVNIGNNVWLGANAVVNLGVLIPDIHFLV